MDVVVNKFSIFLWMLLVIVVWIYSILLILVGVIFCICYVIDKSCWFFFVCSSLFVRYYLCYVFYIFLVGFMYSIRLFECFIFGRFDLVGNSYYFLYVCVVIGIEYVFKMVEFEINVWKVRGMLEEIIVYVFIFNILVVVILVMFLNVCIVFWFFIVFKKKESFYKN